MLRMTGRTTYGFLDRCLRYGETAAKSHGRWAADTDGEWRGREDARRTGLDRETSELGAGTYHHTLLLL